MILKHDYFSLEGRIILERAIFQPPFKLDASMHDEACFLHVRKGSSKLYTPNSSINLKTHDSIVMKCGSYINNWLKNEDDSKNEVVAVHFNQEILSIVYDDDIKKVLSIKTNEATKYVEKVASNEVVMNYVSSLLFYFDNPDLVNDELIKLKVKEVILLLLNTEKADEIKNVLKGVTEVNKKHHDFNEVINTHLFEPISIPDLAVLTGYSLSTFKRKFKLFFDSSPSQYIKRKRIEKAQELLLNSDHRISEIAYDCGFNDLGYFSKSFAAKHGVSPSVYRRNNLS